MCPKQRNSKPNEIVDYQSSRLDQIYDLHDPKMATSIPFKLVSHSRP